MKKNVQLFDCLLDEYQYLFEEKRRKEDLSKLLELIENNVPPIFDEKNLKEKSLIEKLRALALTDKS